MVKDDANRMSHPRPWAFPFFLLTLVFGSLCACGFWMLQPKAASLQAGDNQPPESKLFRLWPKGRNPDVVLLLTGEVFGFVQPCGCSTPQYGGLERRYNFLQQLKQRGWPVVALDLGDVAQKNGPQTLLKYVYSMKAMDKLGYTATGIGRNEMVPLIETLSEFALNNPTPAVLAANLANPNVNFPGMVKSVAVATPPNAPRVGAVAVVAPSIAKDVKDPMVKFEAIENALPAALADLHKQKSEVQVLLLQGTLDDAKKIAAKFPQFQVILCVSNEDEPPEKAERVGNTMIVQVGHKGRCLGTVGVYRTNQQANPFELHYQMAQLGPEYETPAGQDASNPIIAILDAYTRDVKAGNYLAQYPRTQHPIQRQFPNAEYVGSDKCKRCHAQSFNIWNASAHSQAFTALVNAKRPSLRQFDGECVVCHVVGFEFKKGYENEQATPQLKHVGCESCHGPGSVHAKAMAAGQPNPPGLADLMNPFREPPNEAAPAREKRMQRLADSCQKCHDIDNDVHWNIKKWDKIVHKEPNLRAGGNGGAE